jgi:hypothetical protein
MTLATTRLATEKADFRPALSSLPHAGFLPEKTMTKKLTYAEQLRHPNWQKKRLEVLKDAGWGCEICGDTETTLNVHHKRYRKGRMAWEYERNELMALCETCHESHHLLEGELADILAVASQVETTALCAGFNANNDDLDGDLMDRMSKADPLSFRLGVCALVVSHLNIDKIADVARYAASLTRENSKARSLCEKWFSGL